MDLSDWRGSGRREVLEPQYLWVLKEEYELNMQTGGVELMERDR